MKQRRSGATLFSGVVGALALLMLLGFGIDLIVSGIQHHRAGEIVGGAFMAAIGGVLPALGVGLLFQRVVRRAVPGAEPPEFSLELSSARARAGDEITGVVRITDSGHVRGLAVSLRCHDRTPDYQGVSRVGDMRTLATGALNAGTELPFALTVPADAVPSYSAAGGIAIWWDVEARADVFGTDVAHAASVEVGSAVSLAAAAS